MRSVSLRLLVHLPLFASALLIVSLSACDRVAKDDPRAARFARIAAAQAKQVMRSCASGKAYERLKNLAFDEAIRIRNADPANLEALAVHSVIRMEHPRVKSRDEALDVTVCQGRFILYVPPGAEGGFNGQRMLAANIEYTAQAAADGSGLVYQMVGADPIIYKLAAFDLRGHRYVPGSEDIRLAQGEVAAPGQTSKQVAIGDPASPETRQASAAALPAVETRPPSSSSPALASRQNPAGPVRVAQPSASSTMKKNVLPAVKTASDARQEGVRAEAAGTKPRIRLAAAASETLPKAQVRSAARRETSAGKGTKARSGKPGPKLAKASIEAGKVKRTTSPLRPAVTSLVKKPDTGSARRGREAIAARPTKTDVGKPVSLAASASRARSGKLVSSVRSPVPVQQAQAQRAAANLPKAKPAVTVTKVRTPPSPPPAPPSRLASLSAELRKLEDKPAAARSSPPSRPQPRAPAAASAPKAIQMAANRPAVPERVAELKPAAEARRPAPQSKPTIPAPRTRSAERSRDALATPRPSRSGSMSRLASLERSANRLYFSALDRADNVVRYELQRTRRRFDAYLDGCRTETCAANAYADRMAEIRDILSSR